MTTLPGHWPGLRRRGSPVWWRDEDTCWVVLGFGPALAPTAHQDDTTCLIAPVAYPCLGLEDDASNCQLDLTDPTGQAHAAWWVEERIPAEWWLADAKEAARVTVLLAAALHGKADPEELRELCMRWAPEGDR